MPVSRVIKTWKVELLDFSDTYGVEDNTVLYRYIYVMFFVGLFFWFGFDFF